MVGQKGLVSCDTSWFDEAPERSLSRDDFKEFQKVAHVDFRDLLSRNRASVHKAQQKIASQTRILNEVRHEHAGYGVPLLYYTHNLALARAITCQSPALEDTCLRFDMGDSLRRRHIALSHAIVPQQIEELSEHFSRPIQIKNMGAGIGLDVINAVVKTNGRVEKAWNYDINLNMRDVRKYINNLAEKLKSSILGDLPVAPYRIPDTTNDDMVQNTGRI